MRSMKVRVAVVATLAVGIVGFTAGAASATVAHAGPAPNFGPNVIVLSPSMPQARSRRSSTRSRRSRSPTSSAPQRYAILFEPGTYGSAADPLIFQVGYYTQVAGLGARAGRRRHQRRDRRVQPVLGGACDGLDNFWRSLSNLTLNVTLPSSPPTTRRPPGRRRRLQQHHRVLGGLPGGADAPRDRERQRSRCRTTAITGFVSGGFFADDDVQRRPVINGGQQQFFTRNSNIDRWTNGVWNQVFLGDNGAPATSFGAASGVNNQYTTLPNARCPRRSPSSTPIRTATTTCSCRPSSTTRSARPTRATRRREARSRSGDSSSPPRARRCPRSTPRSRSGRT